MERRHSTKEMPQVLLIGPKAPPYGGMGIQAALLHRLMMGDEVPVTFLPSNPAFSTRLRFFERLRGLRPFLRSALFCFQLWRKLPRVDVVHVLACSWLYFYCVVYPAVVLSWLRGKRVVLNYHGGEADRFLRRYRRSIAPIFRIADIVTVPSEFLGRVIRAHTGVPTRVVPNIVNSSDFSYRQRSPLGPTMLVTRHLEELYDIPSVIRAFADVQRSYPDASLWIAGTGTQESTLHELVSKMALRNVVFLGHVPYETLPSIYDQCDILLNASLMDNFPGSLVEAAAAGLVVISTGVGGIPYMFEDAKSALLVEPGDWAGLARATLRVLAEPDLASRLTGEAREQCEQCDWRNVSRVLYDVYGFQPRNSQSSAFDTEGVDAPLVS